MLTEQIVDILDKAMDDMWQLAVDEIEDYQERAEFLKEVEIIKSVCRHFKEMSKDGSNGLPDIE
jgi:hypothetical protein